VIGTCRRKLRGLRGRLRVPVPGAVQRTSLSAAARIALLGDVALSQRRPVRRRPSRRLPLSLPARLQRRPVPARRRRRGRRGRPLLGGAVQRRLDLSRHPRRLVRVSLPRAEARSALRAPAWGRLRRRRRLQRHAGHRHRRLVDTHRSAAGTPSHHSPILKPQTEEARMSLSRVHTSAKAADVAKLSLGF